MIRINFQPYTRTQLETIIRARLVSSKEDLDESSNDPIEEKAITMASMKVSGISGDARRVLDICRSLSKLCASLPRIDIMHTDAQLSLPNLRREQQQSRMSKKFFVPCNTIPLQCICRTVVFKNASCLLHLSSV